jgi:hypothetical protein
VQASCLEPSQSPARDMWQHQGMVIVRTALEALRVSMSCLHPRQACWVWLTAFCVEAAGTGQKQSLSVEWAHASDMMERMHARGERRHQR